MAQRHFVAVGGTGQHVALAYVDLAVLGEWFVNFSPTRLWLFDADAGGPIGAGSAWDETTKQVDFLRRSSKVGDNVWADPRASHQRPYLEDVEGVYFAQMMDPGLGQLLFNDEQGAVSFRNGYYGHPAVASTVFGAVLSNDRQRQRFGDLLAAPREKDARIVVAGSAVGGTGSGVLPKLVEALEAAGTDMNGRLMALLYLPWFRLEGGEEKSAQRNEEMIARTASGLHYYKEVLRRRSATVVLGHPDIFGGRKSRPWQGDTQQSLHDDMALPFVGACVSAQYFSAEQTKRFGLYAVPYDDSGEYLTESIAVDAPTDTSARWNLGRLVRANQALLHRIYWIAEYLDAREEGFPHSIFATFDVPGLRAAKQGWAKVLREWGGHKLTSLRRVAGAMPEPVRRELALPSAFAELRRTRPKRGIRSLRGWVEHAAWGDNVEALVAHVAEGIGSELGTAEWVAMKTSVRRLLPPAVAQAPVQVVANQAPIGTAEPMDPSEIDAVIAHDRVAPRAIPNPRGRELVLKGLFQDTLRTIEDIRPVIEGNAFSTPNKNESAELVRRWYLLFVGVAAGKVRLGGPLQSARADAPVRLLEIANTALAGRFDEARELLWTKADHVQVRVGYTSADTLFVPAAMNDEKWAALFDDIPALDRTPLHSTVAAWVRMMARAGVTAQRPNPGWLTKLEPWATSVLRGAPRTFGLTAPQTFQVVARWPTQAEPEATVLLRLPVAGGRVDASWNDQFRDLGLDIVETPPGEDAIAMRIKTLLAGCQSFTYFHDNGSAEGRVALWLEGGDGGDAALAAQVAQTLQERYYICDPAAGRKVWDLHVDGKAVDVLHERVVVLDEVGALEEGQSTRFPDLPIVQNYLDLVDLASVAVPTPEAGGNSVRYQFRLRGLARPVTKSVQIHGSLIIPASCLMWPNFHVSGWRQRYIWVYSSSKTGEQPKCVVYGASESDGRIGAAVQVALPSSRTLVGFRLPDSHPVPRALYLRGQRERHYGVFLLQVPQLAKQGNEHWGVDFGTSASVVAVHREGRAWDDARLLTPAAGPDAPAGTDATLVVNLGNPVDSQDIRWFPSFVGKGPRMADGGPLPTRLVHWNTVNIDDAIRNEDSYGPEWMLDHGGPISEDIKTTRKIKGDLKWGRSEMKWAAGVSDARRAYLLRLLEQACAWRARTVVSEVQAVPSDVTIVFTTPLRMRSEVPLFEEDVKAVCTGLRQLTGISFTPKFQWESIAGAIPSTRRSPTELYAMVDAGGGSLDLWGWYSANGRPVQRADSLLLGGSSLLAALSLGGHAPDVDRILRALRPEEPPSSGLSKLTSYGPKVGFFFDVLREVVARWLAALFKDAQDAGSPIASFKVGLIGRAWFLGADDWQRNRGALNRIAARMEDLLNTSVALTPHPDVPEGQVARKSYLAKYVAGFAHEAVPTLSGHADDYGSYAGVDLSLPGSNPDKVPWHHLLPIKAREGDRVFLDDTSGQLTPPLPRSLVERLGGAAGTMQDRLNQPLERDGYRDPQYSHWITTSPFHALIEMILQHWKDRA